MLQKPRAIVLIFFLLLFLDFGSLIESLVVLCLFLVYADTYIVVIDSYMVVLLSRFWFSAYFLVLNVE